MRVMPSDFLFYWNSYYFFASRW